MPQDTSAGSGQLREQRKARLGVGSFGLDQFDTAAGSGEQQQALNPTTYARGYEPEFFKPLSFSGGLLEASDPKALATFGELHLKAMKVAARVLNVPVTDIEIGGVVTSANYLFTEILEDLAPAPEPATLTGRPTGPVLFFEKLLEAWELDEEAGAKLLGFEGTIDLRDLLRGTVSLRGRDAKDRLRHLLEIDLALNSLFRNEDSIRMWLREPLGELGGESPLDHLLEGSMEHLLRLRQLVEFLSGR